MKIHEYQAKQILSRHGVKVLPSKLATSDEEARAAYGELGGGVCAVKAQVHAGGRGKGGGVKLVQSAAEAKDVADQILSRPLVTHQTGPKGVPVRQVLVEKGVGIERELYAGITIDRSAERPVLMACGEGGVEIEELAEHSPEKIVKEYFSPTIGLPAYRGRHVAKAIGLAGKFIVKGGALFASLAEAFVHNDCSLLEINPLVVSADGDLIALDAKMNFDDNALYRHKDIAAMRDMAEEGELEAKAAEHGLSYIGLDGEIGCMVNGAGLAMATMDIIKHHGGEPANFLDVGGGADAAKVTRAFELLLSDPKVTAVLVNIFGGIMKCDVIADGIITAVQEVGITVPLVVRLEGTNVDEGKAKLKKSGLAITSADTMADAAVKVIAEAKRHGGSN
ncbi:MAG: ADP-forming succinate--CoA ligase subunit beta [Planctomycetes bacterium]|nr:ADP-forming succinate--CoA ligase subunit beta [Planctomycetota bacterium]